MNGGLAIKTTSALFPDGGAIELIRDAVSGELQLLAFDGKDHHVGQQVEHAGRQFALPDVSPSISRAMTLPSGYSSHGSTSNLFGSIYKVFADMEIPKGAALSATYFSLASWFPDVLPVSPCLSIAGPEPEANLLLELLGCLARRALPMIGTNAYHLSSLPLELQPTLLIDCGCASPSRLKLLLASGRHTAKVYRKDAGLTNFYFAKAVYLGSEVNDLFPADTAVFVNLRPTRGRLPILTTQARTEIALSLQPQLLSYRLGNFRNVEASDFDLPQFESGIRILARTFGAPIVDAPELQTHLAPLFQAQQEKLAEQHWRDPRCAAIEAVLALCHDGWQRVYVGQIADKASEILAGRGETTMLEPRAMGNILRESLGMFPQRSSEGYGIDLTERIRRKIHLLARDFEVAAMQKGLPGCPDCREVLAKPEERQQKPDSGVEGQ